MLRPPTARLCAVVTAFSVGGSLRSPAGLAASAFSSWRAGSSRSAAKTGAASRAISATARQEIRRDMDISRYIDTDVQPSEGRRVYRERAAHAPCRKARRALNFVTAMDGDDAGGQVAHLDAGESRRFEHRLQRRLVGMLADRFGQIAIAVRIAGDQAPQPRQHFERV